MTVELVSRYRRHTPVDAPCESRCGSSPPRAKRRGDSRRRRLDRRGLGTVRCGRQRQVCGARRCARGAWRRL